MLCCCHLASAGDVLECTAEQKFVINNPMFSSPLNQRRITVR